MKMSFCIDETFVAYAKRDHQKDYPFQYHWPWRDGFVLVCFTSRREYFKAVDQFGGVRRFKATVQKTLREAIGAFC